MFILIGEYGSWDNHYHWNSGFYTTIELAEEAKNDLLKEIEKLNYPCPLPNIATLSKYDLDSIDMCDDYDFDSLTDELKNKYYRWYHDKFDYNEFVGLEISEININEKPKNFRS